MTANHTLFAFGSNCNIEELQQKIGYEVEVKARGWCPGYKPAYRYYSNSRGGGALDIECVSDSTMVTPGVVLGVSDQALREIERKEGYPNYYRKQTVPVLTDDGELHYAVTTFVVHPERREPHHIPPTPDYHEIVASAMRAHGHDPEPFRQAAEGREVSPPINHVFVYGTLKSSKSRGKAIADQLIESREPAKTRGRLFDLHQFPGMQHAQASDEWVHGELLSCNDIRQVISSTDKIEGFSDFENTNNFFNRRIIEVELKTGARAVAWTYFYPGDLDNEARIQNGCWSGS